MYNWIWLEFGFAYLPVISTQLTQFTALQGIRKSPFQLAPNPANKLYSFCLSNATNDKVKCKQNAKQAPDRPTLSQPSPAQPYPIYGIGMCVGSLSIYGMVYIDGPPICLFIDWKKRHS